MVAKLPEMEKSTVLVSTADFNTVSRARLESGTAVLDDICRFAIIVDCQRTAFIDLCFLLPLR